MDKNQYLSEKQVDLDFLKEMKEKLLLAPFDPANYEYLLEMINDWINELKELLNEE